MTTHSNLTDFDLILSRDEITDQTIVRLINMLREFTSYGLCRQANTAERKALAERFEKMAHESMKTFPTLKLNHVGAKTVIADIAELAQRIE